MPVDPKNLDKAIAAVEKEYGDVVHKGSDQSPVDRISTGSLELDFATGGGIPIGRFSRFYGGYSSGKSLTCWNVIKNAQAMGLTCVYYNIEKQYEPGFTASTGVDIDKLIVVEGTTIEETATKLESLMTGAHLHVLDSLSSAVSVDELAAGVEEWRPGIAARAWGKALRRTLERFDPNDNTVILVDQVRDVFGSGGEEPPGGRFIEHTSSMSLYFRRSSWLGRNADGIVDPDASMPTGVSQATEPAGIEFLIRVNKSRVCRPFRTARLRLDFENMEFDELFELVKFAVHFGIIEKSGSWFKLKIGDEENTMQGMTKMRKFIEDTPDAKAYILKEVKDRIKNAG